MATEEKTQKYSKDAYVTTARFAQPNDMTESKTIYIGVTAPLYDETVVKTIIEQISNGDRVTLKDVQNYIAQYEPKNKVVNDATQVFGLLNPYEMLARGDADKYTEIDGIQATALYYDKDRNGFGVFSGEIYAREGNKLYLKDKNGYVFVIPLQNNTAWLF